MVSKSYSIVTNLPQGTTGTGLDQMVVWMGLDLGLAGANHGSNILGGIGAANSLNALIVEAKQATGVASNGIFTSSDVITINSWIRQNRLAQFTQLHGDDNGTVETGFHLIQDNGGTYKYRDANFINTVADGIYHIGFQIQNGVFLNEDGNANASVEQVANWLTQFFTDRATTNTGLDRITELVIADNGLAQNTTWSEIAAGADAANGINQLYKTAITTLGLANDGWISQADILQINNWIRSDTTRYANFLQFHGDDNGTLETGFHKVQDDGAKTIYFGQNLVNTVADGMYHIGFAIQNNTFLNEDGNANATVSDVTDWVNYFYTDQSTTGTGLDRIVDTIKLDRGLAKWTSAADINAGAAAANSLNQLIVNAIQTTGVYSDSWITTDDVRTINQWIRNNQYNYFLALHGDDESDLETGYHLVQNDGATTQYFGKNLVNAVADSIYHIGFSISGNNLLNEDGDINASLSDVASWINYFYGQKTVVYGSDSGEIVQGTTQANHLLGYSGNDTVNGDSSNDLLEGGWGDDVLNGGAGDDILYGDWGNDSLNGGAGSDKYIVKGNEANGWSSFQGYDTYVDNGTTGSDRLIAVDTGNVDIGLKSFVNTGIEIIDGSGTTGIVRLLGDWNSNQLNFSNVQFVGSNIRIDGGYGDDAITGNSSNNTIIGGGDNDQLDGQEGSDTYVVTGNEASGGSSFQGYDTYNDSGVNGSDRILTQGTGNVDIGLTNFSTASGIEVINGDGATGITRLLGDWNDNQLDFSSVQFIGSRIRIDGGSGNDLITGSTANDTIIGGSGDDEIDGGEGSDNYIYTGNEPSGGSSFQGYDTYYDTGTTGTDSLVTQGTGNVDIGLTNFTTDNGIESIDSSQVTGVVRLLGNWEANWFDFSATQFIGTDIRIDSGYGDDIIIGNAGNNILIGGGGYDELDGGDGSDDYLVTGNEAGGWSSFQDYDAYNDSGLTGSDRILAQGTGNVDVGLTNFGTSNGIEIIDATGATGIVRLMGNWESNILNFSATQLLGSNLRIDGKDGNDTITGSSSSDTIIGGIGNDKVNGGQGSDTYLITGNEAGGWSSFQGYDTYADNGTTGSDRLIAQGTGNVDIGLKAFAASSGIEIIDGSGATGIVRLIGDGNANTLNFSTVQMIGTNLRIEGKDGNDSITGSNNNDIIVGGNGDDKLTGGLGADKLTGNAGKDRFIFTTTAQMGLGTNKDTIADFQRDQDLVDLVAIDANTLLTGNQAFTYIGSANFSKAGELRFASGIVSGDVNGDKVADFELAMTGITVLSSTNFLL